MNMPPNKAPLNFPSLRQAGSRRQRRAATVVAVLWFIACVAWQAPASLMATLLGAAVPQLELQAVSGSLWHGRAGSAFWRDGERRFALGTLEWQLSPWSLLWLHPSAHVAANYGEQFVDARVRLSPLGSLQLRDARAALPVGALTRSLPLRIDGLLGLRLERVEVDREQRLRALQGVVQWQRASTLWGSRWVALGDYVCNATTPQSGQLNLQLEGSGALAANGTATLDLDARGYAVQLALTPAASLPQELREGIGPVLGATRDAQGRLQVQREGKW